MCIATKALGGSFPPASFLYLLPVDFWGWPCECCDIIFFCPLDRHSCSLKDLHLVWEGRFGCVCSLFIFPQLYCEDTFSDWLPECWLCLEFISQVTATGHFLRVAVINRTLGLVSWGSCNKDVQVVVTENVHKAAALFHAHPCFLGSSGVWGPVRFLAVKLREICMSKQERDWASLLFPPKASHKGTMQTDPFRVYCRPLRVLRCQKALPGGRNFELRSPAPAEIEASWIFLEIPQGFDATWDSWPDHM